MRTLVTGANGLLGGNLCRHLLEEGHEVRALVREGADTRNLDGIDVERRVGDVRDAGALRRAAHDCEILFHGAAVFSYWGYSRDEMFDTARAGAINAIEAAHEAGVRRVILTSSIATLGACEGTKPLTERDRPSLADSPPYIQSKRVQEDSAAERAAELGVELVVALPSMFVGPWDYRPSTSLLGLVAYLTAPVRVFYPGGMNVAHAADVAAGHLLLAERGQPGQRYLLGGDDLEWRTFNTLLSEVAGLPPPRRSIGPTTARIGAALAEIGGRLTGKTPPVNRELASQAGQYFWCDWAKARELGFEARSARDTFVDAVAWILATDQLSERQQARLTPIDAVRDAAERYRDAIAANARRMPPSTDAGSRSS